MARGGPGVSKSEYWSARRGRQWNRLGGRVGKLYDKPSVGNMAKAAWSGVKYLRTLVNSEVHKLDTLFSNGSNALSNSGFVGHLSGIAQGDAINQRTGNSVLASYLSMKLNLINNATAVQLFGRFIIFRDLQQVGDTTAAVTDVLESASPTAFYNASNVGRFQVLWDYMWSTDSTGHGVLNMKKNIRLNKHIRFNGTASTDIQKGGLYILALGDQAVNVPVYAMRFRIGWHDN